MTVLSCIAFQHDWRWLFLAALICAIGTWTTIELLERASITVSNEKVAWNLLTALVGGPFVFWLLRRTRKRSGGWG